MADADTIIFLDIPRWKCLIQIIKRQFLFYGKDLNAMGPECPARFNKQFLKFLRYTWNYNKKRKPVILEHMNLIKIKIYSAIRTT